MINTRLTTLGVQDFRFQFRSGIHPVYLAVSLLYIVLLLILPDRWMGTLYPAIILTDPALIGFLFVGALLFFERDQGLFPLLAVSPVPIREYIISKVLSLGTIATGTSLIIGALVLRMNLNYPLLLLGTFLTSSLFTLSGIAIALRFKNMSSFLILSGGIDIPIILPLISTFGFWDSPLLFLLPTRGSLVFLEAAVGKPQPPLYWIGGTLTLILWMIPAWAGARKSLEKEFTLLPGDQCE